MALRITDETGIFRQPATAGRINIIDETRTAAVLGRINIIDETTVPTGRINIIDETAAPTQVVPAITQPARQPEYVPFVTAEQVESWTDGKIDIAPEELKRFQELYTPGVIKVSDAIKAQVTAPILKAIQPIGPKLLEFYGKEVPYAKAINNKIDKIQDSLVSDPAEYFAARDIPYPRKLEMIALAEGAALELIRPPETVGESLFMVGALLLAPVMGKAAVKSMLKFPKQFPTVVKAVGAKTIAPPPPVAVVKKKVPPKPKLPERMAVRREQAFPKMSDDDIMKSSVEEGRKYIGNINVTKLGEEDIAPTILAIEKSLGESRLHQQVRGVISHTKLKDMAGKKLAEVTQIAQKDFAPGTIFNVEKMEAMRITYEKATAQLRPLAEKFIAAKLQGDKVVLATSEAQFRQAVSVAQQIHLNIRGLKAELGRALGAQAKKTINYSKLTQAQRVILDDSIKSYQGNLDELAVVMQGLDDPATLAAAVSKHLKASMADKAVETYKAFLLSWPGTFFVNEAGNNLAVMTYVGERGGAATSSWFRGLFGAKKEVLFGEVPKMIKARLSFERKRSLLIGIESQQYGFFTGLKRAWRKNFLEETPLDIGKAELFRPAAVTGVKGRVLRTPFRQLHVRDEFYKDMIREMEIAALSYRKATMEGLRGGSRNARIQGLTANPLPEWAPRIEALRREHTFQSPLGSYGRMIQRSLNIGAGRALTPIVPFFRTPVNLVKYPIQRSLAGIIAPRNWRALTLKEGTEAWDEAAGRLLFGTAVGASMFAYGLSGKITGSGPKNRAERETLKTTGWSPYSVKIGDKYISYLRFQPLAATVAFHVDLAETYMKYGKEPIEDSIDRVAWSVARQAREVPYLQGLNNMMRMLEEPTGRGAFYLRQQVKAITPTLIRRMAMAPPTGEKFWSADTLDYFLRGPGAALPEPKTFTQAILSTVPGAQDYVPTRKDIFGRDILIEGGLAGVFTPIRQAHKDPIAKELVRLGIFISPPQNNFRGEKMEIGLFETYKAAIGASIYEELAREYLNTNYQRMVDEDKDEVLRETIRDARAELREDFLWARGITLRE